MTVRVLVVDDGRLNRECLAAQLDAHDCPAATAWDLPSMLKAIDSGPTDVILLNAGTENSSTLLHVGLDLSTRPKVIVFGLDVGRESEIIACAEAGVTGLHLRSESFDHLLDLVRTARDGQAKCSPEVSAILMSRVYAFAAQQNPDSTTETLTARAGDSRPHRPGTDQSANRLPAVADAAHRQESRPQCADQTGRRHQGGGRDSGSG